MPEIPEIETVRYLLETKAAGKLITGVDIQRPRAVNVDVEKFRQAVACQRITAVRRRAKQLILGLSNDKSLVVHFMLEGFMRFFYCGQSVEGRPSLVFSFAAGEQLAFFKINLGYMHLVDTTNLDEMPELAGLGPEPLDPAFTERDFLKLFSARKGMIKPLLMDQRFIAGLGNVYSNEILFAGRLLPTRKANQLAEEDKRRIFYTIKHVLAQALQYGGVYDEKFCSDDQLTGGFERLLQVAYRTGQPCYLCSTPIETAKVGGRNAFYCPHCQQ